MLVNLHQAKNKKGSFRTKRNSRKRWRQQWMSTVRASCQIGVGRRKRKEGEREGEEEEDSLIKIQLSRKRELLLSRLSWRRKEVE